MKGSSGIQRTLKFSQYLPRFGWQPVVLTVNARAYESTSPEQLGDIPPNMLLCRAFALDTKQHLSIKGRYSRFLTLPDRWVTWLFGGIAGGIRLIWKTKPAVIWSTYPIATAHLIAYVLHRLTGIPWVADMRDPMVQDGYPAEPLQWKAFQWIEHKIVHYAAAICFTSPSAIEHFKGNHSGEIDTDKLYVIENGYDEESFTEAEKLVKNTAKESKKPLVLLHSGIIYPSERDPVPFFKAVSSLKHSGKIDSNLIKIVFRATGHDAYLKEHIKNESIDDIIILAPPLPYTHALAEMLTVDGLIIFQAANCNYQIPAKLYEYIRAGRPILGLTDSQGDTANILRKFSGNLQANIASAMDIEKKLSTFIAMLELDGTHHSASPETIHYSRFERCRELSSLFDKICVT